MALARLALNNLYRRGSSLGMLPPPAPSSASSIRSVLASGGGCGDGVVGHNFSIWKDDGSIFKRLMSTPSAGGDGRSESKEVAVNEGGGGGGGVRKTLSRLLPWRRRRRSPGGLWRRDTDHDFFDAFGNALMQATNNVDRLFEHISPNNIFGQIKEKDDHYKLRFEVPGLTKDDIKITVDDGVLKIQGEHTEGVEEEGSDDEFWSSRSYGYYNTSLALPDDAKEDEIKAELKNGVLFVTIPKSEKPKKDVKEVKIF